MKQIHSNQLESIRTIYYNSVIKQLKIDLIMEIINNFDYTDLTQVRFTLENELKRDETI